MLRALLFLLGTVLLAYLGYLALLFAQQRAMMFPGTGLGGDGVGRTLPANGKAMTATATFGRVQGVFLRAPGNGRAPAALYFHGNAEFVDQNIAALQGVVALGVHVLLIEYPGYAGSDGRPSRASLNEAARVGYDWLAARSEVDARRVFAIGRSVGAGPALELSAQRPLQALVLLAAFRSVDDFAHRMGAPAFLARDRYDNLARVRAFGGPLLLFHGRRDGIIPYAHSRALADAAKDAALVPLDCGHNDCPYFDPDFLARLRTFLVRAQIIAGP